MAKVIEQADITAFRNTNASRREPAPRRSYPWHEWADGRTWHIFPGVDFDTSTPNMRAIIYKHAQRHGCTAVTSEMSDGSIVLQITGNTENG